MYYLLKNKSLAEEFKLKAAMAYENAGMFKETQDLFR